MPDDKKNPLRDGLCSSEDMFDQSAAADLMKYLGLPRLHPSALACSQNQNLQILHYTPTMS